MSGTFTLYNGSAEIRVDRRGAEILLWKIGGRDLLWRKDPAIWNATAPILFPVVGWTRHGEIRVDDRSYPLGLHGFASTRDFTLINRKADEAWLSLAADETTKALYPFDFVLTVHYAVHPQSVVVTLLVENKDDRPMPYACGLHPGFAWRHQGEGAWIEFDACEDPSVPLISEHGLFLPETRPIPLQGQRLDLSADLLTQEALCFLNLHGRGLTFHQGAGAALRVDLDHFPHLALWARPPAPFLSIEAWTGHGDPADFEGDLYAKPSMLVLAPGATGRHAVTWTFCRETV